MQARENEQEVVVPDENNPGFFHLKKLIETKDADKPVYRINRLAMGYDSPGLKKKTYNSAPKLPLVGISDRMNPNYDVEERIMEKYDHNN